MSTPLRRKGGSTVIWILMGFLIFGLAGFGIRNFGSGTEGIAAVGDREITARDYAAALRQEMDAMSAQIGQPLTLPMAQMLGIDTQVRARLIGDAALAAEAGRIGLSVGDAEVARQITTISAFQNAEGKFDREVYRLRLDREGLGEAEFESRLRDDITRGLFRRAVADGVAAPRGFVDAVVAYQGETRDFTLAELLPSDLAEPVPAPTEADLKAFYEANPDTFTRPETRVITYVWLRPEDLAPGMEVDDAALRAAYDARRSEFVVPERRRVERIVFGDQAEADAARARLDAGTATFADLAAERGLAPADIDLGEVTRDDLGQAGDTVFGLAAPGIVGPVMTDLGPALFAMNAILPAEETPFEDVRDDLLAEARLEKARRAIADRRQAIEDLLASGATLEDAAREQGLTLGTIEFNDEAEGGLAAYSEFREAAAAAKTEDFPELRPLQDGGLFALRLDRIEPPAVLPLDAVRDRAAAEWTQAETLKRLKALGEEQKAALDNGATLESLGLVTTRHAGFARGGYIADTPAEVATAVFATTAGQSAVVEAARRVFVLTVTGITPADPADPDILRLRDTVAARAVQGIQQDLLALFTGAVETGIGITINQRVVDAVNAQLQ
ncbi:MAG: peptidyl-prolyl cis-trans isomerase [Rhodobacteraceae bacterium]|nr:peptidyl-prolyl cis-trans isomerase [Paracoccaceae bacterium]